jgi:hypothetical protein
MATTRKTTPTKKAAPSKRTPRPARPKVERPSNINAIGIMTLVSGVLNLTGSVVGTLAVAISLVGLVCVPFTLLPGVLGLFEILYGLKLLANPPQPVRPSRAIAGFQIATFIYLNIVSGVIGILALTLYTDPEVEQYFEAIN